MHLAVMLSFALAQMLSLVPATDSLPSPVPALEASGQYADAARVLEEAASHDPASAEVLRGRAIVFRAALGDLDAVDANLSALRREGVAAPRIANLLLDVLVEFGDAAAPAARVLLLQRCLRRGGGCGEQDDRRRALQLLGDMQRAVGELEAAERAYQAADALAASEFDRLRAREGILAVRHPRFVARTQPVFRSASRAHFGRWVRRVFSPWVQQQVRDGEELVAMFPPRAEGSSAGEHGRPSIERLARLAEVMERVCLAATERPIPPDIAANPDLRDAWLSAQSEDSERVQPRSRRCGSGYALCEAVAVQRRESGGWLRWCADRRAQIDGPLAPAHDELLPAVQVGDGTVRVLPTVSAGP